MLDILAWNLKYTDIEACWEKKAMGIPLGEESHVRQDLDFQRRRMEKDVDSALLHKVLRWSSEKLYRYIQREMEINPLLKMQEDFKREIEETFDARFPVDMDEWFQDDCDDDGIDRDNTDDLNVESEQRYKYHHHKAYEGITLQEYLMLQLKHLELSPDDERIAAFIIKNLDENGYLTVSKYEIAAILQVDRERVSRMLRLVQTLDPPGVGARSLKECLLIQLSQMGKATPLVKAMILEHLKDMACNRLSLISKKTGVSIEEVQRIRKLIRSLEPKPGRRFASLRQGRYTGPDVVVKRVGEEYHAFVLEHAAPRLRINRMYLNLLQKPYLDKDVSEYIANKLDSAIGLIKALEQRRIALNKVAMSLILRQKKFLDGGLKYLGPLTLQMMADDCNMPVCIVSLIVEDKYIQTPHGIFDLKRFLINF